MANVIKDIGEIWTRLFDHRPFLNGEIKFFLQEFEEKRGDREVEKLFGILQSLTEIKYTQFDHIKPKADDSLPILKQKIDEVYTVCNSILENEAFFRADCSLEKKRERRKAEWELFIKDISHRCVKIDEAFNEKEKDLREHYSDLEKKLKTTYNHSHKSVESL